MTDIPYRAALIVGAGLGADHSDRRGNSSHRPPFLGGWYLAVPKHYHIGTDCYQDKQFFARLRWVRDSLREVVSRSGGPATASTNTRI